MQRPLPGLLSWSVCKRLLVVRFDCAGLCTLLYMHAAQLLTLAEPQLLCRMCCWSCKLVDGCALLPYAACA
jgi:hypothetical protein